MADDAKQEERMLIRKWLRRTVFIILIIVVIVSAPFILDAVATLVAGGNWDAFTESWFGARGSAQVFLAGFATIVVVLAVIMYLILGAFSSDEGGW